MVQMRNALAAFVLALLLALPGRAQNIIQNFAAHAENDDYVVLEWNSGSEAGLTTFRIERSLDGLTFITLQNLAPQGSNSSYRYEDHDLYKSSTRTYYYRVRALLNDGTSSLSSVQSVTLAFSGIVQTWGSIKALFR